MAAGKGVEEGTEEGGETLLVEDGRGIRLGIEYVFSICDPCVNGRSGDEDVDAENLLLKASELVPWMRVIRVGFNTRESGKSNLVASDGANFGP